MRECIRARTPAIDIELCVLAVSAEEALDADRCQPAFPENPELQKRYEEYLAMCKTGRLDYIRPMLDAIADFNADAIKFAALTREAVKLVRSRTGQNSDDEVYRRLFCLPLKR